MNVTFIATLIFSLGFFGVWFIGDFLVHPPNDWRGLGIGLIFIVISLLLSIGFVKIG
jgi:hypothetical protein